jgi:hypothetical protein
MVRLLALTAILFVFTLFSCQGGGASDGGVEPWTCEGDYVWEDLETGLCWMKEDARIEISENEYQDIYFMDWWDADTLCSKLEWGGYRDWRLPRIQELVGLIRGCPSIDCPVDDPDCLDYTCNDDQDCAGCATGPGAEGCYWPYELGPSCSFPRWSTSLVESYSELAWCVAFSGASVFPRNRNDNDNPVRCVRGNEN